VTADRSWKHGRTGWRGTTLSDFAFGKAVWRPFESVRRAFGGDSQIVGKVISLSGDLFQVVGIMAAGVQTETPEAPDVWLPLLISPNSDKQVHYFQAVGRLKPGITLARANAQLQLMTEEFRRCKYPSGSTIHSSLKSASKVE
jgi:hypothetical protein